MKKPGFPKNEKERQKAIERYQILDTIEEESFDNITSLLSYICDAPISLVSLLDKDRNFLKSHYGVPFNEDPRERSFCGHTILEKDGFLIVADATKDNRFFDNPLVTEMGVRFYAGAALVDTKGLKLGALCVFGKEPKTLSENQKKALHQLSKQVMLLMESRLLNLNLMNAEKALSERNKELEKFAATTSHDLKSPLSNIISLVNLLKDTAKSKLSPDENKYIDLIKSSSTVLSSYITGLLSFYRSEQLPTDKKSNTKIETLTEELVALFSDPATKLTIHTSLESIAINKELISQILMNLITNGFKYNRSATPTVTVTISETEENYCFAVTDNGIGIAEEDQDKIFELFETSNQKDREGNKGTGIGLATVKKLISNLEGTISVTTVLGEGATFTCLIPKE